MRAPRTRTLAAAVVLAGAAAALSRCGGGLKTISKDGYQAVLSFSKEERFAVAVRGESRRVEAPVGGSTLVKVARPDLGKVWQYRPTTKRILETAWSPTEEIVPGYPLEPKFDPHAYADRFGAKIRQIGDAAHGLHPCERWEMSLPSGDAVIIWVARDLERLAVKVEQMKKDQSDEYQPFTTTELLDVRTGADPDLFEKPKGYTAVKDYAELTATRPSPSS
jgi:hypothetical protein